MATKISIKVEFQYKAPDHSRPGDWVQEEDLEFEVPEGTPISSVPIPAVGDTVTVSLTTPGSQGDYKVLTRHFTYMRTPVGLYVIVQIVVTDVEPDDMAARVKS
jgi:hypothetical protein